MLFRGTETGKNVYKGRDLFEAGTNLYRRQVSSLSTFRCVRRSPYFRHNYNYPLLKTYLCKLPRTYNKC